MARILNDSETKAILKALMMEWQKDKDEQLGLNVGQALLCQVEVDGKMDALLNNEDNYEYHLHQSEWFDENVSELLSEYHNRKAQEQAREQEIQEMVDGMKVTDCGNGMMKFQMDATSCPGGCPGCSMGQTNQRPAG